MMKRLFVGAGGLFLLLAAGLSAWAADSGAVVGGAVGAAAGAAIGHNVNGRSGAIIGAAVGAATGAVIGGSNGAQAAPAEHVRAESGDDEADGERHDRGRHEGERRHEREDD